jgi:tetraacyldisaccharide 4'-kinase
LLDNGFRIEKTQAFPDHHRYQPEELDAQTTLLMTEKDAVKCKTFAAPSWFYLPISAQFNKDFLGRLQNSLKASIAKKNNL